MQKIPTLFVMDYPRPHEKMITRMVRPGFEWVANGKRRRFAEQSSGCHPARYRYGRYSHDGQATHGGGTQGDCNGLYPHPVSTASIPLFQLKDRVFWDDGSGERKGQYRQKDRGKTLVEVYGEDIVKDALPAFSTLIATDHIGNAKTRKFLWEQDGISIEGSEPIIERELRRVVYSGTMSWNRQLVRPAHEVAVGIWMAGLEPASSECAQTRQNAPVAAPKAKPAPSPTPAQTKRLATLDALLAEGLVTQVEYDAKRKEILAS